MTSTLSLFECITRSPSLSLEDIKLTAIFDWIFQISYFLRSFMTYFKCSLILLRYSSNDGVLFLPPLLHIQYNCYFKNHLLLLLCNHFLFLHSQITLSLIASFSFFSLKRCLISLIAVSFISFCSLKRFRTSLFSYFLFFIFIMP